MKTPLSSAIELLVPGSDGRLAESRKRAVKARSMLLDLYGNFAVEGGRGGAVRLAALVQLGADVGISETAIRSAAVRMLREGWLSAERHKRESVYVLTVQGHQLIYEGRRRMFNPPDAWWSGVWCVVTLTVPETRRDIRDRLRKRLSWLGFGSPSSSFYVSTHDYRTEVLRMADELKARAFVQVYRSEAQWPDNPRELVARAWGDLTEVSTQYGGFLDHFAPQLARTRARIEAGSLDDREAFIIHFTLTNRFRRCLSGDPDLPLDLLPAGWNGVAARLLFHEFHALLGPQSLRYFDHVCSSARPGLEARSAEVAVADGEEGRGQE